jgi:hypothetical protein
MEYHVSINGNDANPGTETAPYRTVQHGIGELDGGDMLTVHNGVYYEHLDVRNKTLKRIIIRSAEREHAVIDGTRTDFLAVPSDRWLETDMPGVYKSVNPYPPSTSRGAFDQSPYTRLITYVSLKDLAADNETFGPMPAGTTVPDGVNVKDPGGKPPRRPFVYMGPGLYQDEGPGDQHVYVRLTHTHHGAAGVPEYTGPEDPRLVPLAVWTAFDPSTVFIHDSGPVTLYGLTIRNGGGRTVRIARSAEATLDHVTVLAGPYGLDIGDGCKDTRIRHTRFDGGLPPWFFRSDKKDGYIDENDFENELGGRTLKTLLTCEGDSDGTLIEFCEFVNAHDLVLNGTDLTFTRNWLNNINDDGVFVGKTIDKLIITTNVFEQCLTALSVATNSDVGIVYFHRNLVDLRQPTIGRRPSPFPDLIDPEDAGTFRYGQFFKSNFADPEINVFQNTMRVFDRDLLVSYNLFKRDDQYTTMRRAFNNIFLAVNRTEASDIPIYYLPRLTDQAETDGNSFFRISHDTDALFISDGAVKYADLSALPAGFPYEVHSIDVNPRLRRYWGPPNFPVAEDLRPVEQDPAGTGGVLLPDQLAEIDGSVGATTSHIGCYAFGAPPLEVGVEGRRLFPSSPLAPPPGDFA